MRNMQPVGLHGKQPLHEVLGPLQSYYERRLLATIYPECNLMGCKIPLSPGRSPSPELHLNQLCALTHPCWVGKHPYATCQTLQLGSRSRTERLYTRDEKTRLGRTSCMVPSAKKYGCRLKTGDRATYRSQRQIDCELMCTFAVRQAFIAACHMDLVLRAASLTFEIARSTSLSKLAATSIVAVLLVATISKLLRSHFK